MMNCGVQVVAVAKSFNPEPQATAVFAPGRRPETAGACGFGLNEETAASVFQCDNAVAYGLPLND
jgi:hypothetical protein